LTAHLPNYDHDFDGRPPVAWHGDEDPLLAALVREHPELIPAELVAKLQTRPRSNLLAAAG
jgi:hypothetical protein